MKNISPVPQSLSPVVADLWRLSSTNEVSAFQSSRFHSLEKLCRSIYLEVPASRFHHEPSSFATPNELQLALHNFFRRNGAPWYGTNVPKADETAFRLHSAFLATNVQTRYLIPLDRFALNDPTLDPQQVVPALRFGQNEIRELPKESLRELIPYKTLQRFGSSYEFPLEDLSGFHWLICNVQEEAGPLWRRTWLRILYQPLDLIGTVPVFASNFSAETEDALFVLLLTFLKKPDDTPWKPFSVPWIYSLTDDPFADVSRTPDHSVLTCTLVGGPDDHAELPDQSESFDITNQLRDEVHRRWSHYKRTSSITNPKLANFHPLTRHFFVKALIEHGIDEIVAAISCMEATLRLPDEWNRTKLKNRYTRLVHDTNASDWLDRAYNLRNDYLHGLANAAATVTWKDLAQTRWCVARAVDEYLNVTSKHMELNRQNILELLDQ